MDNNRGNCAVPNPILNVTCVLHCPYVIHPTTDVPEKYTFMLC